MSYLGILIVITVAISLTGAGLAGFSLYLSNQLRKTVNDLDTETMAGAVLDFDEEIEANQKQLAMIAHEIQELKKEREIDQAKFMKLDNEYAELHEFVNRGIKRMSTRAQRAEMISDFNEDLEELDEKLNGNSQADMFRDPNKKPKLVRTR